MTLRSGDLLCDVVNDDSMLELVICVGIAFDVWLSDGTLMIDSATFNSEQVVLRCDNE